MNDDLGYHDLSVMGSPYYETPNIDRIGEEGIIFTNGYATCQVCSGPRIRKKHATSPEGRESHKLIRGDRKGAHARNVA